MRISLKVVVIAGVGLLMSCVAPRPSSMPGQGPGATIAEGTVVGLSSGHGNAYTSIAPDQYEALGLAPGRWIHVAFEHTALTLVVGQTYTDVPSGTPVAVLHREGLTFAICDGNFSARYGVDVGAPFTISAAAPR